jgi:hypothetical protein
MSAMSRDHPIPDFGNVGNLFHPDLSFMGNKMEDS